MLGNSTQLGSKFSFKPAITMAEFMMTMNMATQAFAIDGTNAENVQTTGGAHLVLKGVHIAALTADAELDISADTQLGIWTTAQSYTSVDVKYVADSNGNKTWYKCIASHTSAAVNKPGQKDSVNATWRSYWTESSNRAENGVGNVIAQDDTFNYLALVNSAGTLTIVKADDGSGNLQIPQFDPEVFAAIGTLSVTPTSGTHTLGTTVLTTVGTFAQLIGPVFPTGAGLDQN
jgi:hypothetical protein